MLKGEHSAILLPALSENWSCKKQFGLIFEWPLKTGFTVQVMYNLHVDDLGHNHLSYMLIN